MYLVLHRSESWFDRLAVTLAPCVYDMHTAGIGSDELSPAETASVGDAIRRPNERTSRADDVGLTSLAAAATAATALAVSLRHSTQAADCQMR